MRKTLLKRIQVMAIIKLSLTGALWGFLQWQAEADHVLIKCLLITYGAYILVIKLWIAPFRHLEHYLHTHPQVRFEELENDLQQSQPFEHKLWIGNKWSYYLHKQQVRVIENCQIIWIYSATEDIKYLATHTHNKPTLVLGNRERKRHYVSFRSSKTPLAIMALISEKNHSVVVGFSTDKLAYFESNILDFLYNEKRVSSR